jgi:hypothetical protein
MHPVEALSRPVKDLDLKSNPSRLFVRGEYTKIRSDRTIFPTQRLDIRYPLGYLICIADDEFVIQTTEKLLLNIELLV